MFNLPLKRLSIALLISATIGLSAPMVQANEATSEGPVHQLRIYQIFENNKQAFHDRFRDHADRIMKEYGFNIVAMWEAKTAEKTEFVYLLKWPSEAAMKEAWAGFMANQEWKDIKKRTGAVHGKFVGGIEDRTLRMTDYSPDDLRLDN
ncbi:NIPSNAP family protein [Kordiimonas sp.]|uniref:NIPSNAP family protein n=1 Tax=Kordiimonas sp. TaxID=1970157 RepID=UPI003A91EA44